MLLVDRVQTGGVTVSLETVTDVGSITDRLKEYLLILRRGFR